MNACPSNVSILPKNDTTTHTAMQKRHILPNLIANLQAPAGIGMVGSD
jgi:hypothetical protein